MAVKEEVEEDLMGVAMLPLLCFYWHSRFYHLTDLLLPTNQVKEIRCSFPFHSDDDGV